MVSFADTPKALAILAHVRELRPELPVIVRTLDDTDVGRLREAGAAEIVAEVVEGSLMLATQTMLQLGMPLNRVLRRLRDVRQERYQLMRGFFPGVTDIERVRRDAAAPAHRRGRPSDAACVGKTLGSAQPRRASDVQSHRGAPHRRRARSNPRAETRLEAGDVLVLLGTQENLAKAEIRLLQG